MDKKLKKLSRVELLELMISLSEDYEQLADENNRLRKMISAQRLPRSTKVGSIAEAALQANGFFAAAQKSADEYLREIKHLRDELARRIEAQSATAVGTRAVAAQQAEQQAQHQLQQAQARANQIVAYAKAQADAIVADARARAEETLANANRQSHAMMSQASRQAASGSASSASHAASHAASASVAASRSASSASSGYDAARRSIHSVPSPASASTSTAMPSVARSAVSLSSLPSVDLPGRTPSSSQAMMGRGLR